MKNFKDKLNKFFKKHKKLKTSLLIVKKVLNVFVYIFAIFCFIALIIGFNNDTNSTKENHDNKIVQKAYENNDYLYIYDVDMNVNMFNYVFNSSQFLHDTYISVTGVNYTVNHNGSTSTITVNYLHIFTNYYNGVALRYYIELTNVNPTTAKNRLSWVYYIPNDSMQPLDVRGNVQSYGYLENLRISKTSNIYQVFYDSYNYSINVGSTAPTYNTINLINSYYNNVLNTFTYDIDDSYITWADYIGSSGSNATLYDGQYVYFKGLGVLQYLDSNNTYHNVSALSNITDYSNYYYYGSQITQQDLNNSYNLGYQNGLDANFGNVNLTIGTNISFNEIYSSTYLNKCLPNVYFNNSLNDFYSSSYDLTGLEFNIVNENIVYDTIRINFKRLSDYSYTIQNSTYLAFVNDRYDLDYKYIDYSKYQGATNYLTLLGVNTSKLNSYYVVDTIQYIKSSTNTIKNVFNGIRTQQLNYYVQNDPNNPTTLVDSGNVVTGVYFVRNGWLNDEFRRINVSSNNELLLNVPNTDLNNYTLFQFLNGDYSNNSIAVSNDVNNAFSLLGGAFDSMTGLLSISVLPGITLGVLMFIPLVVTIIFVVIRIIKKG